MARAATVLPIAEAKHAASKARVCQSLEELRKSRAELEASDGYKRAGLEERLTLREGLDSMIRESGASGYCDKQNADGAPR